ncbi:DUF502 domain-containing protein [bacterium]|nr:DUF502 domain-containing protein [bacterium]
MPSEPLKATNMDEQGARVPPEERQSPKATRWDVFRRRFIAGLITVIPVVITIWVIFLIVGRIDSIFGPFVQPPIEKLVKLLANDSVPADRLVAPLSTFFALIVAVVTITMVGWLTRFLFVRRLIQIGEGMVTRVPLVKFFYLTPKEVINTLTTRRDSLKRVVLIEYPRRGIWCLAYATGEIIRKPDGEALVMVFLPTTPNPTSGFLLMLPMEDVHDINLSVEDGIRLIISGGILAPNAIHTHPFVGLDTEPDLPPSEPLTSEIPPELVEAVKRQPDDSPDESAPSDKTPS